MKRLVIEPVENGYIIFEESGDNPKTWVASGFYDITDIARKYYNTTKEESNEQLL